MRLLQRYILFELLKVFSFLLSILTVLLVFAGVFREATDRGLGPAQALQILPYVVPEFMPILIPATLLLTVCLVYGRIAGDQEVTAAKAAGINVLSLLWPGFLVAAVLSLVSLVLTDQVIPWASKNIQRIVTEAMEDVFLDMLRAKHYAGDPSRGVSVMVIDVEGRDLVRPTFKYAPEGREPYVIQAERATLRFDLANRQVLLHLVNGQVEAGGTSVSIKDDEIPFPLPKELREPKPRQLSIRRIHVRMDEVRDELAHMSTSRDFGAVFAMTLGEYGRLAEQDQYRNDLEKPRTEDLRKLYTEVHSRLAMSSSCLFFALIGGPFAMLQARRQFLTSFIICFVPILTVYYPLVLGMMNLCKTGQADPAWAMWIGNAALLVVGMVILRKVLRH